MTVSLEIITHNIVILIGGGDKINLIVPIIEKFLLHALNITSTHITILYLHSQQNFAPGYNHVRFLMDPVSISHQVEDANFGEVKIEANLIVFLSSAYFKSEDFGFCVPCIDSQGIFVIAYLRLLLLGIILLTCNVQDVKNIYELFAGDKEFTFLQGGHFLGHFALHVAECSIPLIVVVRFNFNKNSSVLLIMPSYDIGGTVRGKTIQADISFVFGPANHVLLPI